MYPYDEFDVDYDVLRGDRRAHRQATFVPNRRSKRPASEIVGSLTDVVDTKAGISFTYEASRHERAWMLAALSTFVAQGVITDVLRLARGGKEANVYVCAAGPGHGVPLLAAKIYRPRRFRNLRNDALYRAGRSALDSDGKRITDHGALHAIRAGTSRGKEMAHTSWLAHELNALQLLYAAGADVPRPFAGGDNVILMQYIGSERSPAPALHRVRLRTGDAGRLFERVLHNVDIMLANRRIHGDLSAYNILYWEGDLTLIDFPQAVDPFDNPAARRIFQRDLVRVCEYFAACGVRADPAELAESIWSRHVPADLWQEPPPMPDQDGGRDWDEEDES